MSWYLRDEKEKIVDEEDFRVFSLRPVSIKPICNAQMIKVQKQHDIIIYRSIFDGQAQANQKDNNYVITSHEFSQSGQNWVDAKGKRCIKIEDLEDLEDLDDLEDSEDSEMEKNPLARFIMDNLFCDNILSNLSN